MRKIEILIDGAQGTRCKVGDILTIDTINEATETIHTKAGGGYPGYLFDTFKEGEYFRFVDSDDYWKVGQKVRCIKQYGGSFKVGKIYTINVSQHSPNGQCNKNWNTVSENGSREGYIINNKPVRDCFELVTEEDEVKLKDVELKVKEQKVSKSADEIVQGIHAGLGGLVDSVLAESRQQDFFLE